MTLTNTKPNSIILMKAMDMYLRYKSVSVFSHVAEVAEPLAKLTAATSRADKLSLAAEVFRRVANSGADSTGEWLKSLILVDDNIFSRTAAKGERVPDRIKAQVKNELLFFKQLSLLTADEFADDETKEFFPRFGSGGLSVTYDGLTLFYSINGCGRFAASGAFVYRDGILTAVPPDSTKLSDLMNYAEEKNEIVKNTENFIAGLPAFHTLLYGDRGTGKSTTVRAIANEYRGKLKVIELARGDLKRLPELRAEIAELNQKFIIFIDDLVFDENDRAAEELKTALEGSLDSTAGNCLIYCTSNRRHLYKESDGERRRSDDVQAELALFDRFGLVITYINPDKDGFVDILRQILRARSIKWRDEYAPLAELAALKKGGRSPRAAKQIADLIECTYAERLGE